MDDLAHIDLFSGIGGFSLAAESARFKTILFCEIDEFCQKVLKERFWGIVANSIDNGHSGGYSETRGKVGQGQQGRMFQSEGENRIIPIIPDIRNIDGTKFSGATLLTGGFPCQPFSQAGQRRGKDDDRHLWPEMLRVISEAKPTWVVGENVAGIKSMEVEDSSLDLDTEDDNEKGGFSRYTIILDEICSQLENIGYEVQPVIIPACAKNAPHRRDRVWIIANSTTPGLPQSQKSQLRESLFDVERDDRTNRYPNGINVQGTGKEQDSQESFGLYGGENYTWEENWLEVAARFCRVDDGLPSWVYSDRVKRLKALGNAIVPQVAYEIIKGIYRIENDNQT